MARVHIFSSRVKALEHDPRVVAQTGRNAAEVARRIAARAPRDTGAGASSIHAEPDPQGRGFRVGWDKAHFYLSFAELGTERQPATPFARPVADEINRSRS